MMGPVFAIYKKDLKIIFTNPMFYLLTGLCCVLWGTFFSFELYTFVTRSFGLSTQVKDAGLNIHQHLVSDYIVIVHYVLVFVLAALSLRYLAEEKKAGTFSLLLTSPLASWQIILAKWFVGATLIATLLLISALYPLSLLFFTTLPMDLMALSYFGLFIILCTYMSAGLVASAVTDSLIVCVVLSLVLSLFLLIMAVGREFTEVAVLRDLFSYLSYDQHFARFRVGLFSVGSTLFFISWSVFFSLVAERIIEFHRWR